jgi:hypothetical protein
VTTPDVALPSDIYDEVGLADWMEVTMLVEQRTHLSRAKIRRYLTSVLSDDDPDVTVDLLLQEVARRQRACPSTYPFADTGSGLTLTRSSESVPYLFMLAISVSKPYRAEHRQKDTDELFDELVLDALMRYIGPGGDGLRFGAPASGSRPKNFHDSVAWLAKRLNLPLGAGHARKTGGDGGLDVIVWRSFRDRRAGYLIVLAQCTVQKEWVGKARDLAHDVWRGWIDLGKDPHLVLAIPFVVSSSYDKWDDLRRTVHAVLDRLRLCELLEGQSLRRAAETGNWIASEIARMTPVEG